MSSAKHEKNYKELSICVCFFAGAVASCAAVRFFPSYLPEPGSTQGLAFCSFGALGALLFGCSAVGRFVLPVISFSVGACVCRAFAAVRVHGGGEPLVLVSYFVLIPLFLLLSGRGFCLSSALAECFRGRERQQRREYIFLSCAVIVASALILLFTER